MPTTKPRCLILQHDDADTKSAITGLTVCGKSVMDARAVTPRLDQTTCPLCLNRLDEQAAKAKAAEEAQDRDDPFWAEVDRDWEFEKEEF